MLLIKRFVEALRDSRDRLIHIETKIDELNQLIKKNAKVISTNGEKLDLIVHQKEQQDSEIDDLKKQNEELMKRLIDIENKENKIIDKYNNLINENIIYVINKNFKDYSFYLSAIPDSFRKNLYPEQEDMRTLFIQKNTANNISDYPRLISFVLNINHILMQDIKGAFAEVGVYLGNNSAIMSRYCTQNKRSLYMFDTFEGFSEKDLVGVDEKQKKRFMDTSLEDVKKYVGENEYTHFIKGYFPESITEEIEQEKFAFVSLDCDLYKPIKSGLEFFWPRMSKGGMIFVHDYSSGYFEGCKKAVDEFCEENGITGILMPDKSGTFVLVI